MAVEIQKPEDIRVVKETIVRKDSNNNDIIVSNVIEEKENMKINYTTTTNNLTNDKNRSYNNIENNKNKKFINKSLSQQLPLKIPDDDFERKGSTRSLSCFINPELTVRDMVLSEEVTIDMYNQDPTYVNVKKIKKKNDLTTTSSVDNDSGVLEVKSERNFNRPDKGLYDEKITDFDQINSVEISETKIVKQSEGLPNKNFTTVEQTVYSNQYEGDVRNNSSEENERTGETSEQLGFSKKESLLRLVNASNDAKDARDEGKNLNVTTTDNNFEVEQEVMISSQTNTLERFDAKTRNSQLNQTEDNIQFKFKVPKEINIQKQQKFTQPPRKAFLRTSSEESSEIARQGVTGKGKDVLKKVESFEAEIKNQHQKYQRKPRTKQKILKRHSSSEYDLELLDSDILNQSQLVKQHQYQLEQLQQKNDLNEEEQVMREVLFKQFKEEQKKLSKQQLLKQHILRQQQQRLEEEEEQDPLNTEKHAQNFHNTLQRFNSKISDATTDENVEVNEVKSGSSKGEYIKRYNTENLNFDGKVQNYVDNFENGNEDYVNVPKKVGKLSSESISRIESKSLWKDYVKTQNPENSSFAGKTRNFADSFENGNRDYVNDPQKHSQTNVSNNSYYENKRTPIGHQVTSMHGRVYDEGRIVDQINGKNGLVEEEIIEKTIVVRGQKPQVSKNYSENVAITRGPFEDFNDIESRSSTKTNQYNEISYVKLSDFKKSGTEPKITKQEKSKIYTLSNGSIEKNYDEEANAVTNVNNVYENNVDASYRQREDGAMMKGLDDVDGRYTVKTRDTSDNWADHERFKPTELNYKKTQKYEDGLTNEIEPKVFISSKPKFTRQISPKVEEQKEVSYTNYKQIMEKNIEERNKNLSPKMIIEDPMTTYKRTQVEYEIPDKEHYRKNIIGRTEAARQKIERKSSNEQILHDISRDIDQYHSSQVTNFEPADSEECYDPKSAVHVGISYERKNYKINPDTKFSNNEQRAHGYTEQADVGGINKQTNYTSSAYDNRFNPRQIEHDSVYNIEVRNEDSLDRRASKTKTIEEHKILEKPVRTFKNLNKNDSLTPETAVIESKAENYFEPKDEIIRREIKSNVSFGQKQMTRPFENEQISTETLRSQPTLVYESYRSYGGSGSNEETSEVKKILFEKIF